MKKNMKKFMKAVNLCTAVNHSPKNNENGDAAVAYAVQQMIPDIKEALLHTDDVSDSKETPHDGQQKSETQNEPVLEQTKKEIKKEEEKEKLCRTEHDQPFTEKFFFDLFKEKDQKIMDLFKELWITKHKMDSDSILKQSISRECEIQNKYIRMMETMVTEQNKEIQNLRKNIDELSKKIKTLAAEMPPRKNSNSKRRTISFSNMPPVFERLSSPKTPSPRKVVERSPKAPRWRI